MLKIGEKLVVKALFKDAIASISDSAKSQPELQVGLDLFRMLGSLESELLAWCFAQVNAKITVRTMNLDGTTKVEVSFTAPNTPDVDNCKNIRVTILPSWDSFECEHIFPYSKKQLFKYVEKLL